MKSNICRSLIYGPSPSRIEACLAPLYGSKSSSTIKARGYATQSSLGGAATPRPSRKQVTVANDDGRVKWGDLSTREKAARTTQQTFNFGVIIVGLAMTV